MILWKWNGDFRFKCHNSSGRIGAHFFGRLDFHTLEVDRVSLCGNSHNCRHACRQSGRNEICRRKGFPFSFIIDGRIGRYLGSRRFVRGRAVKLAFV